jgi:hypothetical protein
MRRTLKPIKGEVMKAKEALNSVIHRGVVGKNNILQEATYLTSSKPKQILAVYQKFFSESATLQQTLATSGEGRLTLSAIEVETLVRTERLDQVQSVKDALKVLASGQVIYEDNLCRDLGIPKEIWKRVIRTHPDLLKFQVELPNRKRVWGTITELQKLLRLPGVKEVR